MKWLPAAALFVACGWAVAQSFEQNPALPLGDPAIQYFERATADPVALLQRRLDRGETKLEFQPDRRGYLASVLRLLDVNVDSQLLVFSKTSFQAVLISPEKPRAVYFNDRVAVGSVQDGDVMELASLDPAQGIVFYTLDVRQSAHPHFERRDGCLHCHQGIASAGVPGLVVSSLYTSPSGMPAEHSGHVAIDHRSPLADRWGGWYVEGSLGSQTHRGNMVVPERASPEDLARLATKNAVALKGKVDTSTYLADTSDVVALMTLEHQAHMTNLITRVGWDARLGVPDARLDAEIGEMVAYMLFADEAPLKEPIRGVSSFTKTFPQRGPLREFDLTTRLFRYPLSYMIYSEAFDALPARARDRVYRKLFDALTRSGRNDILRILRETKPDLPAYWRERG